MPFTSTINILNKNNDNIYIFHSSILKIEQFVNLLLQLNKFDSRKCYISL